MRLYDFTLRFALAHTDADPEMYLESLAMEGCDDAIVGLGNNSRIALNFTRQAASAYEAIFGALSAVRRAIPDAKLVEVNPDLVGLTDIAELLGFTRQNMRKLMLRSGAEFPPPLHEGKPAIWHLSKILQWLKSKHTHQIDESLLDVASVSMQCNLLKGMRELDPKISKRLRSLIA
jgi:predicted DNA-binding transcriptional regulator AlpA